MTRFEAGALLTVAAVLGTTIIVENVSQNRLREENALLRRHAGPALESDSPLPSPGDAAENQPRLSPELLDELIRLRWVVTFLLAQTNELDRLKKTVRGQPAAQHH